VIIVVPGAVVQGALVPGAGVCVAFVRGPVTPPARDMKFADGCRGWVVQALRVKRAQEAFDSMMEGYKAIGGYEQ
jgi:hypothetical protein